MQQDRRELGDRQIAELSAAESELDEIAKQKAKLTEREEELKQGILHVNAWYEFPEVVSKSEVFGRLKITYPEANYGLDFNKFIELYGKEAFERFFKITKAELDVATWTEAVRNEEVKDSDLLPCILDARNLKPRLTLMKDREEVDEEEW